MMSPSATGSIVSRLRQLSVEGPASLVNEIRSSANLSLALRLETVASQVDDLVTEALHEKNLILSKVSELEDKVATLRAGPQDSLDGVRLLVADDADKTIKALREASTIWDSGLLPETSQALIEAQIRSKPLNARAASLLGHPIATAVIPTANEAPHQLMVIPDTVVSPPQGYVNEHAYAEAARNYLADNPNRTTVMARESYGSQEAKRFHLLSAPIDTTPRTVVEKIKGWFRTTEQTVEKDVTLVFNTDATSWPINGKGVFLEHPKKRDPWPEGHRTFLSATEMDDLGLTRRHVSETAHVKEELAVLQRTAEDISRSIREIKPYRDGIIAAKTAVGTLNSEMRQVSTNFDRAGERTAKQWEEMPLLTYRNGDEVHIATLAWDEQNHVITLPTPHRTVAETIAAASLNKSRNIIAVMQDSTGVNHLAFTNINPGGFRSLSWDDIEWARRNPDVRALVNPVTREVVYASSNTRRTTRLPELFDSPSNASLETRLQKWCADNLVGQNAMVDDHYNTELAPWSDGATVRMLEARSFSMAQREAVGRAGLRPDPAVFLMEAPTHLAPHRRYFLMRSTVPGSWDLQQVSSNSFRPEIKAIIDPGHKLVTVSSLPSAAS